MLARLLLSKCEDPDLIHSTEKKRDIKHTRLEKKKTKMFFLSKAKFIAKDDKR